MVLLMGCLNISILNVFDINRGFELLSFRVWDTTVWWFDVEILFFDFSSEILLCTTMMYVFLMNNFSRISWQQQKWITLIVLSYNFLMGFLLSVVVVNMLVWAIYLISFQRLLIMFKIMVEIYYTEGVYHKVMGFLERGAHGYIIWGVYCMYWYILFNYVLSILYRHVIIIATGIMALTVDVYLGGTGCDFRAVVFNGVHAVNLVCNIYYVFQLWYEYRKYVKSFVLNCKSMVQINCARDWVWSMCSTALGCYELRCRRRSLLLQNGSAILYVKLCIIFNLNIIGEIVKDQIRFIDIIASTIIKQRLQCVTCNSTTGKKLLLLQYVT